MKAHGLILAATLALTGCGAEDVIAPPAAGHWTFELTATELHAACVGSVTLTERGPGDPSVVGLSADETYVDGLWSCSDGSTGIMGGTRVDNSIELALTAHEVIWLRSMVEIDAVSMNGAGFRAQRD